MIALLSLTLASCSGSVNYASHDRPLAKMPSHIASCPSIVQLNKYAKQYETMPKVDQTRMARELLVALRRSELRNNRCLQQALAYYERIRAQRGK